MFYERKVRKQLEEIGFPSRKVKHKPSLTAKDKKTRLQRAKEKQSWTVDAWIRFSSLNLNSFNCYCTVYSEIMLL